MSHRIPNCNTSQLFDTIVEILRERGPCTFIEIEDALKGRGHETRGNATIEWGFMSNVFLWRGVAGGFADAIESLLSRRSSAKLLASSPDRYQIAGRMPRLPVAEYPPPGGGYETAHWLPVELDATLFKSLTAHSLKEAKEAKEAVDWIALPRTQHKACPVDFGNLPKWLGPRLQRHVPKICARREQTAWRLLRDIRNHIDNLRWIDDRHAGSCNWYGKTAFVSEPHDVDAKTLESIQNFAQAIDCEWALSSNFNHFRGRTFRVVIFEKDEVAP